HVTRWCDLNGNLSDFYVKCAWEVLRPRGQQDKLRSWDVDASTDLTLLRCSLCGSQQDSHEHFFFKCTFSSQDWNPICNLAGMEHVPPILEDIVMCLKLLSNVLHVDLHLKTLVARETPGCLDDLLLLEEELCHFFEAAELARSLVDVIKEADLLEKVGHFKETTVLLLLQIMGDHRNSASFMRDMSEKSSSSVAGTSEGHAHGYGYGTEEFDECTLLHRTCEIADVGMIELLLQYGGHQVDNFDITYGSLKVGCVDPSLGLKQISLVRDDCPNLDFDKPEHRWKRVKRSLIEAIEDMLSSYRKVKNKQEPDKIRTKPDQIKKKREAWKSPEVSKTNYSQESKKGGENTD
nr:reverse transcriptase domain, reverse transcriptase zinc-binding domain protein [Tanacetum cinerariifolium]